MDNLREGSLKIQEIRVMMHLKHRNICTMVDFYTSLAANPHAASERHRLDKRHLIAPEAACTARAPMPTRSRAPTAHPTHHRLTPGQATTSSAL